MIHFKNAFECIDLCDLNLNATFPFPSVSTNFKEGKLASLAQIVDSRVDKSSSVKHSNIVNMAYNLYMSHDDLQRVKYFWENKF